MTERLVTLTCNDCRMEPAACWYDGDDDPMAVGMVAGIARHHRDVYPEHDLEIRRETTKQLEKRMATAAARRRIDSERIKREIEARSVVAADRIRHHSRTRRTHE